MLHVFGKRRKRLAKQAADNGTEKILICNPINILYFTGIKITPYERFIALLLDTRTGHHQLILPSIERGAAKDAAVDVVLYSDQDDPLAATLDFLAAGYQIGVEKTYLTLSLYEKIAGGLERLLAKTKLSVVDISEIISQMRQRKDAMEVDLLRKAALHSDKILKKIAGEIRKGQTEREVVFKIMSAMVAQPELVTDEFVILVLSGPGSADPHGYPSNRALDQGDSVIIDFGVCFQHYWSDCTRTFFTGTPNPQLKKVYEIVLEAQRTAIAAVRPGVSTADVDRAARNVIELAGYGDRFIHRVGHGIGLSIHEPPSVHGGNPGLLEEGMVITIEPGIYLPGIGGIRIEDDVVVAADGANVLTQYPKTFLNSRL